VPLPHAQPLDPVIGGVRPAALVALAALTVAVTALTVLRFADTPATIPAYVWLVTVLAVQTAVDLRTRRLPREITNVGLVIGALLLTVAAIVSDEPERIRMMLIGAAIATLVLWLIHVLSGGDLGEGDVRLAPLLGLYLGWLNPAFVFVALLFAFVAGAAVGVALLATRRVQRDASLPFGPFLALGTVLAVLVGQPFLDLVLAR
jgi:leader peptidase (prepilin peptidase) / N-methyltransferase